MKWATNMLTEKKLKNEIAHTTTTTTTATKKSDLQKAAQGWRSLKNQFYNNDRSRYITAVNSSNKKHNKWACIQAFYYVIKIRRTPDAMTKLNTD